MRALLVVNPKATATTRRGGDILARALGAEVRVDVAETTSRGHAITLAQKARADGIDLVVALGGDGTVNEVVNGLLVDGRDDEVPLLAVVPGGSANVFSRNLGFSADPVVATSQILDALRAGRARRVGLGRADGRWFTFTAGFGFDAEVVQRVERQRGSGQEATPGLYVRAAVAQFLLDTDRHRAPLTIHRPDHDPVSEVFFAIVANTSPWTYLGTRPVTPTPEASVDTGLDVIAPQSMGTVRMLRTVVQALRPNVTPRGRRLVLLHDVPEIRISAERPTPLQVDGDYVGERDEVTFTAEPAVLRVVG